MATREVVWRIKDGPNREELFDGLRLRAEKRTVDFEFVDDTGQKLFCECDIGGIDSGVPTGEGWDIHGFIVEGAGKMKSFRGPFNTRTRKGNGHIRV